MIEVDIRAVAAMHNPRVEVTVAARMSQFYQTLLYFPHIQ